VLATALGPNGSLAVLTRTSSVGHVETVAPGRPWTPLATPPDNVVALAWTAPATPNTGAAAAAAFAVTGTVLTVFSLTPSGTRWVKIQTTRVPLAYGSSG